MAPLLSTSDRWTVHYVGPQCIPIDAVAIKKHMIVSGQVGAIMKTAASVVQNTQSKLAAMGGVGLREWIDQW